jgi:hypothetical protein
MVEALNALIIIVHAAPSVASKLHNPAALLNKPLKGEVVKDVYSSFRKLKTNTLPVKAMGLLRSHLDISCAVAGTVIATRVSYTILPPVR